MRRCLCPYEMMLDESQIFAIFFLFLQILALALDKFCKIRVFEPWFNGFIDLQNLSLNFILFKEKLKYNLNFYKGFNLYTRKSSTH